MGSDSGCDYCDYASALYGHAFAEWWDRAHMGSRDGRWRRDGVIAHCTTCHLFSHLACDQCGACLPNITRWVRGDHPDRDDVRGDTRGDRRYCSNACRQRAYRERRDEVIDGEWVS